MRTDLLGSSPPTSWAAIVSLIALLSAVLCVIDFARHPNTRTPEA